MIELAHWSALAPLAFLALFRRDVGLGFWICALAFLASFVADTVALLLDGSWAFVPMYRVAQYGLFGLALLTPEVGALLPSVALYAGLGTVLYFGMMQYATPDQYEPFMRWWYPYQATRLASFGLFINAAWRAA